jgi:hypothetical protein
VTTLHDYFRNMATLARSGDNVLAPEIVEDLKAGLEQFREIAADLSTEHANPKEK